MKKRKHPPSELLLAARQVGLTRQCLLTYIRHLELHHQSHEDFSRTTDSDFLHFLRPLSPHCSVVRYLLVTPRPDTHHRGTASVCALCDRIDIFLLFCRPNTVSHDVMNRSLAVSSCRVRAFKKVFFPVSDLLLASSDSFLVSSQAACAST